MSDVNEIQKRLEQYRVVPVIAIRDAGHIGPLADALVAGGLPVAEVTFRTVAAESAIRTLANRADVLVGAGTVLTTEQADQARTAGAQFVVAPGFNPNVVRHCMDTGMPVFPGVCTPTDIEMALEYGLGTVKFFPAEAIGGVRTLKALAAPYAMMKFIPTGGINPSNLKSYLSLDCVIACGGSWMVKPQLCADGRFDQVEQLARAAVEIARGPNSLGATS